MLRSLGRDASKRTLTQSGGIPQMKCMCPMVRLPSMTTRAGGDATDVVGSGRSIGTGDEIDKGAFTDAGLTRDDNVAGDEA